MLKCGSPVTASKGEKLNILSVSLADYNQAWSQKHWRHLKSHELLWNYLLEVSSFLLCQICSGPDSLAKGTKPYYPAHHHMLRPDIWIQDKFPFLICTLVCSYHNILKLKMKNIHATISTKKKFKWCFKCIIKSDSIKYLIVFHR